MTNLIQVVTTVQKKVDARRLARKLVEERLAACVQISGPVQSHYRWEGKIVSENEYVITLKSRDDLYNEVQGLIKNIHPYEVPEILCFKVNAGAVDYTAWVEQELKPVR